MLIEAANSVCDCKNAEISIGVRWTDFETTVEVTEETRLLSFDGATILKTGFFGVETLSLK